MICVNFCDNDLNGIGICIVSVMVDDLVREFCVVRMVVVAAE
jgi:hypothetical protein